MTRHVLLMKFLYKIVFFFVNWRLNVQIISRRFEPTVPSSNCDLIVDEGSLNTYLFVCLFVCFPPGKGRKMMQVKLFFRRGTEKRICSLKLA